MKSLDNILNASKPLHLTEDDDDSLEAMLQEPTDSTTGDIALVMARLSDIIDMADDLYNTASELADVDEGTQNEIVKIYNCLDNLYKSVKDKYSITTPEYDFDADGVDDLEESTELTEGTLQKSKVKASNWLEADEYKSLAKVDWFESAEWEWMPEKKLYGRKAMVEAKALTVAKLKDYNWLSSEEYASVRSKVGFKPDDWALDEGRMLYKRVDKYSETYKRIFERLLGEKVPLEFKELAEDSETIIVPENKKLSNAALKKIAELYLEKKLKIGYKAENKEIAEKVAAIFAGESATRPAPSKKLESFMKH